MAEKLDAGLDILIVDVRSGFEFVSGHLTGAVHLPFWKIPFCLKGLPADKSTEIILYCEHGPRAVLARTVLSAFGYECLTLLDGHMHRWRKEGRKIVKI